LSIFDAATVPVSFNRLDNFSFEDIKSREQLKKNSCILLGVMVPEKGVKAKYNDNHKFYKYLDLYANVSLSFSIPSIKSRHSNVDIAVIRENT
jgi:isocitrate dehydrogenase (NAD+)